jgi:hypothetical protein
MIIAISYKCTIKIELPSLAALRFLLITWYSLPMTIKYQFMQRIG